MPSTRAVLADIRKYDLDPSVAHVLGKNGRLARPVADNVVVKEVVAKEAKVEEAANATLVPQEKLAEPTVVAEHVTSSTETVVQHEEVEATVAEAVSSEVAQEITVNKFGKKKKKN